MAAAKQFALQRTLPRIWLTRGLLAWLLWPLSLVFGAAAALHRSLYRLGWRTSERVNVPVIVVGNVIAGGAGKTPVVIAMVRHFLAAGIKVGVISRGYGRQSQDCHEVGDNSCASDVGDEPALIRLATGVPVVVAARRIEAAKKLLAHHPDTQLILCDDGLQHLALHRDLEICVFDDRGTGNNFLLPAGPLREPWPRRVDLVLHTGQTPKFAGYSAVRALGALASRSDGQRAHLHSLQLATSQDSVPRKPLLALAAIANPEDFFAMLRQTGLQLLRTVALPDHYDFADNPISDDEDFTVLCTEKDARKLWRHRPDAWAVPLILTPEVAFFQTLDAKLAPHLPTLLLNHGHTTA